MTAIEVLPAAVPWSGGAAVVPVDRAAAVQALPGSSRQDPYERLAVAFLVGYPANSARAYLADLWRASEIPDTGSNRVRPGMEDGECQNGAGSLRMSSKDEAVKMVIETSRPIAEVARDIHVNEGTLGNWVNTYRAEHAADGICQVK